MQSQTHTSPIGIDRAHEFKHTLWRRQEFSDALDGALPEIITTDGHFVRRMLSQRHQIIFQEFADRPTASALITRIESSVTPGIAMVGYSMFKDRPSVAILNTGSGQGTGWLAFPDERRPQKGAHLRTTLPLEVADMPRMRLVGGAALAWVRRRLVIQAALEQRGSAFARTASAFHVFEHLTDWHLEAVTRHHGELRNLRLCEDSRPRDGIVRVGHTRIEGTFEIDEVIYRELRAMSGEIWFRLVFDGGLFALPPNWPSFWLKVDLTEPPGMFF